MPDPGNDDDADRHGFEHLIVALERRRLGVTRPVGFEDDLRRLAIVGPAGGDALGATRATAVQQHHVRMLGERLVEPVPDRAMVVEVEAAGEGDLGSGGEQRLDLGAMLGGVGAIETGETGVSA